MANFTDFNPGTETNNLYYTLCDVTIDPLHNFNGATAKVREWMNNFI